MFPGILTNWKQNKHTQANRRPPTNNKQTGHQQEVFQPRIPPAPSPAVQQTNKRPSASCKPIHASSAPATSPPAEQTNKQPPASQHPKASQQPPRPPQARQQAGTLPSPPPRQADTKKGQRRGNRRAHYPAPPPDRQTQKKVRPCDLTLKRRLPTLPQLNAVPSALMGLTSLFGMGRGGTPLL